VFGTAQRSAQSFPRHHVGMGGCGRPHGRGEPPVASL